jgi:hypothetical protein
VCAGVCVFFYHPPPPPPLWLLLLLPMRPSPPFSRRQPVPFLKLNWCLCVYIPFAMYIPIHLGWSEREETA